MKKMMYMAATAAAALAIAGCGSDDGSDGTTAAAGETSVSDAWARVTTPTQTTGAAYMTIESPGGDTLTAASVPSSVAGEAQLHEATGEEPMDSGGSMDSTAPMGSGEGMMGMREVDHVVIPADGTLTLEPGGYHIMLLDLVKPIEPGATIPVTLELEKAGEIEVDATAEE
ncbi:MAG: copper chaperone PCu(A)C [Acidobacteria bacterium]|nr:MAG: copper chaperone PCu(A)C [Acidobacteriota bacterium]MCL4286650.1 copper chaperone PCu(A)C [Thermoleophilia bacterium]GIK76974.1 MAG: exported protein [Actinomycetes bacterium]